MRALLRESGFIIFHWGRIIWTKPGVFLRIHTSPMLRRIHALRTFQKEHRFLFASPSMDVAWLNMQSRQLGKPGLANDIPVNGMLRSAWLYDRAKSQLRLLNWIV